MSRMTAKHSTHDNSADASGFAPSMLASVTYRVLVTVQDGVHRGAAQVAQPGESILVGADTACHLVLMDEGVGQRALQVLEDDGQLVADVLDHGVMCAGRELPLGPQRFALPQVTLRIGSAELQVELLRRSRRGLNAHPALAGMAADPAALNASRAAPSRSWLSLTLAGLGCAALLAAAGGAVNATSRMAGNTASAIHPAARELPSVGTVLAHFNAQGAQLLLNTADHDTPTVLGLVNDAGMRHELELALQATGQRTLVQVHDVKQMTESLTRLARLGGYTCGARHLGDGRFACDVPVPDEAAAARLKAVVPSVPGVQSLAVRVSPAQPVVHASAGLNRTLNASGKQP